MIERKTLMSLGFLEKQNLTGSYQGMRYLLKKQKEETARLIVMVWPQPYCSDVAPEELRQTTDFDFSEEGMQAAVQWLNEQYEVRKEIWENAKL